MLQLNKKKVSFKGFLSDFKCFKLLILSQSEGGFPRFKIFLILNFSHKGFVSGFVGDIPLPTLDSRI